MNKCFAMLGLVIAMGCGCVETINPVLKDEQVITDNSLAGSWVPTKNANRPEYGKTKLLVRAAGEDKRYSAELTDPDGKKSSFTGRLGKIGDVEVAEFTVDPADIASSRMGDHAKGLLLNLYYPVVIHQTDANHITAQTIKMDWMKKGSPRKPLIVVAWGSSEQMQDAQAKMAEVAHSARSPQDSP